MHCTLILVAEEFLMLLFKGNITFSYDINIITRAKRTHQVVKEYTTVTLTPQ